jgi:hypothetical protein
VSRPVSGVESGVALAFVLVVPPRSPGTPWLLVAGFVGHGLKDLWQHRTGSADGASRSGTAAASRTAGSGR